MALNFYSLGVGRMASIGYSECFRYLELMFMKVVSTQEVVASKNPQVPCRVSMVSWLIVHVIRRQRQPL